MNRLIALFVVVGVLWAQAALAATNLYVVDITPSGSAINQEFDWATNRNLNVFLKSYMGVVNRNGPKLMVLERDAKPTVDLPATDHLWRQTLESYYGPNGSVGYYYNFVDVTNVWDIFKTTHELRQYCGNLVVYDDQKCQTILNYVTGYINRSTVSATCLFGRWDSDDRTALITAAPYSFAIVADYTNSWTNNRDGALNADKNDNQPYISNRKWLNLMIPWSETYNEIKGLDYVISERMFSMYLDPDSNWTSNQVTQNAILDAFAPAATGRHDTLAYGWWLGLTSVHDNKEGESNHKLSEHGISFFGQGYNTSLYRWFHDANASYNNLQPRHSTLLYNHNVAKKYVMATFTQGDNMTWITHNNRAYWDTTSHNPSYPGVLIRNRYPFGIFSGTPLMDVSSMARYYYHSTQNTNQWLIAKPYGYTKPETLDAVNLLQGWMNVANVYMPKNGTADVFINTNDIVSASHPTLAKLTSGLNARSLFFLKDFGGAAEDDQPFKSNGKYVFTDPTRIRYDANGEFAKVYTFNAIRDNPRQFNWLFIDPEIKVWEYEELCDKIAAELPNHILMSPDQWLRLFLASRGDTLTATRDSYVKESNPTLAFGTDVKMRVRETTPNRCFAYVRFDIPEIAGPPNTVQLKVYNSSAKTIDKLMVDQVSHLDSLGQEWTESNLTWDTMPTVLTGSLGESLNIAPGTWSTVSLSGVQMSSNAPLCLRLRARGATDSVIDKYLASRETTTKPQLTYSYNLP